MTKSRLGWAELPWLSGVAIAAIVMPMPVAAATLDSWQFDAANHQLVITLPKNVTPRYYLVAEPARIVVDLPNTEVGAIPTQQSYDGAVRQIRIAQFQPGLTRIVLELSPQAVLAPGQVELRPLEESEGQTQRWSLRPLLVSNGTTNPPPADTPTDIPANPAPDLAQAVPIEPATESSLPTETSTATPSETPTETATNSTEVSEAQIPEVLAADLPDVPSQQDAESAAVPLPAELPEAPEATPELTVTEDSNSPTSIAAAEPSIDRPNSTATDELEDEPEVDTVEVSEAAEPAALPPLEPGAIEIPIEQPDAEDAIADASPAENDVAENDVAENAPAESPSTTDQPEATAEVPANPDPAELPEAAPTPAPIATQRPAAPTPLPVAAVPTAVPSAPLPVDFSQPPRSEPLELATPSANAASLSVPSVGQTAVTPAQPIPSTLSFPAANTSGVTVPSLATVQPTPTETTTEQPPTRSAANGTRDRSQPTGASAFPTPSAVSTQPATPVQPVAPVQPATPVQPAAPAAVPFGQPLAANPTAPNPIPLNAIQAAQPAIPFGQPIPSTQVSAATQPTATQPAASERSGVSVIQFGEPLPFSQPPL